MSVCRVLCELFSVLLHVHGGEGLLDPGVTNFLRTCLFSLMDTPFYVPSNSVEGSLCSIHYPCPNLSFSIVVKFSHSTGTKVFMVNFRNNSYFGGWDTRD